MKFTHCSACGEKYLSLSSPRKCHNCDDIHWFNPTPVVVIIQSVYDSVADRMGYIIAQRGIKPCYGEWALIAGHVELTDKNIFQAAKREFNEETSLSIADDMVLVHCEANDKGHMMFVVSSNTPLDYEYFLTATLCEENLDIGVVWEGDQFELCFPIHQKALMNYMGRSS